MYFQVFSVVSGVTSLFILSETKGNITILTPNTLSSKEFNIKARIVFLKKDDNCRLLNEDLSSLFGAIFVVQDKCNDTLPQEFGAVVKLKIFYIFDSL